MSKPNPSLKHLPIDQGIVKLDQWDRSVIIGLLLGGSAQIVRYTTQQGTHLHTFFMAKSLHGFEPNKNLISYAYSTLYAFLWRSAGWNIDEIMPFKNPDGSYRKQYYAFELLPSKSFDFFAKQFFNYKDVTEKEPEVQVEVKKVEHAVNQKKKVIPKLIHRWLTPLSLCVMFYDCGGMTKQGLPFFDISYCNGKKEIELLKEAFEYNFNIEVFEEIKSTSTGGQSTRGTYLIISEPSVLMFFELIEPFMKSLDAMSFHVKMLKTCKVKAKGSKDVK